MKSLMASWSFMGMVAGHPAGLWLWFNPFTSPFVLAETTPTPCTVPSTCPLVKVAIFGPASELGWVQQQQMVMVESRFTLEKSWWKSWSKFGSETKPYQGWFRSRPIKASIYNDLKTHEAFGEDAYQKRAVPLVPVEALIPYIYVLTNNSFIDFIKEREKEREEEGGGRERREREGERPRAFTVYLHPRSFVPASWHPFIFLH